MSLTPEARFEIMEVVRSGLTRTHLVMLERLMSEDRHGAWCEGRDAAAETIGDILQQVRAMSPQGEWIMRKVRALKSPYEAEK